MVFPAQRSARPSTWLADGELVAGVRGGDERSFDRLVERYRGPVIAYVRARIGDHGLSEDISQEIFISALRSLRATEQPIAFKSWIYEIARNACIDQHRRRGRHAEPAALSDDLVELGPSTDPHAAFEVSQQLAALCLAFGALPPHERELLGLRELAGLPYAELASCTGLTVPAVESALHRARQHLLAHYGPLTAGGPPRPVARGARSGSAVGYYEAVHRGVAQPGSAHRSGR